MEILRKLICVDDSKVALKFYEGQFELYGFKVYTADGAQECMELLESGVNPSCILTDYEMPEVNGLQLCQKIKKHAKFGHLPIIVLTSKDSKKYLLSAIESGADDFVGKNIDPEVIVSRINAAVRTQELVEKQIELERFKTAHAMITTYNHEINNPLAVAFGMLGKELKELDDERYGKVKNALNRIMVVVKKIDKLIEDPVRFQNYSKNSKMIDLGSNEEIIDDETKVS